MKNEYYYCESDSPDIWNNDDLQEAAHNAWCDFDDTVDASQDGPVKGDTLTIYRGKSDPIKHKELSLDIREHITDRLYELVGEAAELTTIDDDVQTSFDKWLSENIEINTCRIVKITPINIIYDGNNWELKPTNDGSKFGNPKFGS